MQIHCGMGYKLKAQSGFWHSNIHDVASAACEDVCVSNTVWGTAEKVHVCTSVSGLSIVWYFQHKVQDVAYSSLPVCVQAGVFTDVYLLWEWYAMTLPIWCDVFSALLTICLAAKWLRTPDNGDDAPAWKHISAFCHLCERQGGWAGNDIKG